MSFAVPTHKKKSVNKSNKKEPPVVIDLHFDKEVGLYSLEFAGRKTH